ncbi:AAA family ATPase [Flexistipes sp.]|uniref:AAA family ATPase n=1 Tax=Flexistipes sp. TaxID=3088135 RepID=UPI002E1F9D1E|nr:AAA family ATPase [Flexistipes sp.]
MYNEYFGFTSKPFINTPDPDLFYCSESHEKALEAITYGIRQRSGFLSLIADVGSGKTTLCRVLLNKLTNVKSSLILNPFLTPYELLCSILEDFGINIPKNANKSALYKILSKFLINNYKEDKNVVIIIDEAQNLSFESLEMLRQISNIELENDKLVQILLVGQPELEALLRQKNLRQLNQRIAVKVTLEHLNNNETENYINFRITESLKYKKYIFSKPAINAIYKYTKGNPREINHIADKALLLAAADKKKQVNKKIVKAAYKDYIFIGSSGFKFKKSLMYASVLLILIITAAFTFKNSNLPAFSSEKSADKKQAEMQKSSDSSPKTAKTEKVSNADRISTKSTETENTEKCARLKVNLNFRAKPSLNAEVIKVLSEGSIYVINDIKDKWIRISEGNRNGWIVNKKSFIDIKKCGES